jgi:glycyl-tRNA synthetase beta chain
MNDSETTTGPGTARDLLVEVGVEELPHAVIDSTITTFAKAFEAGLKENQIGFGHVKTFSTPRRMGLLVHDLNEKQDDYREEKRGPSVAKAYLPDGKPSSALFGFLRGNNAQIGEIVETETDAGRYVFLVREISGVPTVDLIPDILHRSLQALSFPKTMRWNPTQAHFARPIRWILLLFGSEVIGFSTAGVESARTTFGHRAYSADPLRIESPNEYEQTLLKTRVVADRDKRIVLIRDKVSALAENEGLRVVEEAGHLFAENADLTEYPNAVLCSFHEDFLELPREVLISEMIEHQHYFPLETAAREGDEADISARFIAVSNIENNDRTRQGYERVLNARLNDGKFFFDEDRKHNFGDLLERLRKVLFHVKIGTMHQKVERIAKLGGIIARELDLTDKQHRDIEQVALLCKNDLTTLMVNEFPHLQGVMGYYYALSSGYERSVALGVREHYLPRFSADRLPSGTEGAVVGIADRLDTLLGIFSIGLKPKGSKDPFALRRSVLAVIRIIIHLQLHLPFQELLHSGLELFEGDAPDTAEEVENFFVTRVRTIFVEMGFRHDEIEASLGNILDDPYEAYRRVEALHSMRGDRDFEDLLVSFKRMSNIIRDYDAAQVDEEVPRSISEDLLLQEQERELYDFFVSVRGEVEESIESRDYSRVYRVLSTLKPYVDRFFDHVLVMDEDKKLRGNRILLLSTIAGTFARIIDFSKIVQPGE